jgi:DNA-3-methyladenine glycosylase II
MLAARSFKDEPRKGAIRFLRATTNNGKGRAPVPRALTARSYARGLSQLAARDCDLALILARHGRPPLWAREPGFATLVLIILEQQVSVASARATYERLLALDSIDAPLTPAQFLALDDATLRGVGFSRQKTAYVRHLAESLCEGAINLEALAKLDDEGVRAQLTRLKGIGAWTAEIYLLMALRRPDAWPAGDLALAVAAQSVKHLDARPTPTELDALSERWRPLRAIAARLLWQHYLARTQERARVKGA